MKIDIGEVLRRMWKIGWNHKVLWLFQMLPGLLVVIFMPIFFLTSPYFTGDYFLDYYEPVRTSEVILPFVLMLIVIVPSILLQAVAQAGSSYGALQAERGREKLAFGEIFRESLPYLLRVMGLYIFFGAAWFLVIVVFMVLMMGITFFTMGIGMLCMMPFFFLIYPIAFLGYIVLELAQAGIVADDLGVMDSIARGWQLFRSNLLTVSVLMLILYFGLTIISSVFMFPMMIPMMALPMSIESSGDINQTFFTMFGVLFPITMVVMLVVQGILMAFFQSAWVVAYLRLTAKPETPVIILPEANV
jgi:hypothetical protein